MSTRLPALERGGSVGDRLPAFVGQRRFALIEVDLRGSALAEGAAAGAALCLPCAVWNM